MKTVLVVVLVLAGMVIVFLHALQILELFVNIVATLIKDISRVFRRGDKGK